MQPLQIEQALAIIQGATSLSQLSSGLRSLLDFEHQKLAASLKMQRQQQQQQQRQEQRQEQQQQQQSLMQLAEPSLLLVNTALASLDPAVHTLGFIWLLRVKFTSVEAARQDPSFIPLLHAVLSRGDEAQLQLAGYLLYVICDVVALYAHETMQFERTIAILVLAIQKAAKPGLLTIMHVHLSQLAQLAQCFHVAHVFDADIVEISPTSTSLKIVHVLSYYYYVGMIYCGLKQWRRAMHFFGMAVSAPANTTSLIAVESYRKYVLASLLHSGKVEDLPKYTSSNVVRTAKQISVPYVEFAALFEKLSLAEAALLVASQSSVFLEHTNLGLVKQCMASLTRRIVQRLTQTFITLSLTDIATHARLSSAKEAEHLLVQMIESGEIHAQISQRDGMVAFKDDPNRFESAETVAAVDAKIRRSIQLHEHLSRLTADILTSSSYIKKTEFGAQGSAQHDLDDMEASF
ncbi:hypothetical protein CAOG_05187 [Capsaspora owczarzaki ATCC 30864]|uniref:COP9 signalosome complex subunit 3 n=1 Tax=Capsaspora owczarzaki (strain ATCC 30864) TaxID=595528 RepID=A0A0D2X3M3_CAPO3|nr:hypothetical protein CAOG_05187 [Capsaspora owczarzaki ATCC 30864]KJE94559.1 hypothetical protein CAOG_005187 [Capsaspora owczarzaki ATCC 30864]|eukprot:XP_004346872.1 hypothetical protein CAOG_05187 [Capsaspora owczarzaki ATCC 30864]